VVNTRVRALWCAFCNIFYIYCAPPPHTDDRAAALVDDDVAALRFTYGARHPTLYFTTALLRSFAAIDVSSARDAGCWFWARGFHHGAMRFRHAAHAVNCCLPLRTKREGEQAGMENEAGGRKPRTRTAASGGVARLAPPRYPASPADADVHLQT
jgi:hypothetical protein